MAKGSIYEHVVMPRDVTDQSVTFNESYIESAYTAYLYDRVEIRVTVGDYSIEKGRVKLGFHFSNKASGQMLAKGYQVIFIYDYESGKRIPIPEIF